MNNREAAPSCWTCVWQVTGAPNLLGDCRWFAAHGKGPAKPIPTSVVDKGCAQYEKKQHRS